MGSNTGEQNQSPRVRTAGPNFMANWDGLCRAFRARSQSDPPFLFCSSQLSWGFLLVATKRFLTIFHVFDKQF